MFSFWKFGGRKKDEIRPHDGQYSPLSGPPEASQRRVGQSVDDDDDDEDEDDFSRYERPEPYEEEQENEDAVDTPLLPIFSAALLDKLPLYNITHTIRLLIVQRCETTLSWDQLRSPQISQFLVKPIQNEIRANHFNRATLCALIANCLQFQKEGQLHPGSVGVAKTRAWLSELLAMRLVKEYTTRELIDALSYDFDPLQGRVSSQPAGRDDQRFSTTMLLDLQSRRIQARGARVSTIEISIRASAKKFLAHPLVVQHLEAIWAGTVVFHAEADSLHRKPAGKQRGADAAGYGTIGEHSPSALPADSVLSRKAQTSQMGRKLVEQATGRRTVTLYDPHEASLFKLSRLRVPRYRQVFSTISFAIMLGLFLAVLVERSLYITPLEVVFWVWSAGYMLDEVVGFTEQGFGLYILSFWNAFDLGILGLFVVYYCLRLYGIVLADRGKHRIANMAYDALASTAILLFPRLFSVLDHYRYFSQLLIAFRMMAQDLMAILILILISCSGFFVAFTLSFSDAQTDGNAVAYALFQILMGFTPAAWEKWPGYNLLGKAIMSIFLIICHFLIVTILITVLTNSFMAIVQNANEEHQFLFAVNTISMVKSDALFSYIAPTNVLGWVLTPLRYLMPFRQYVKLNRTIIKFTHLPVLFVIFAYERLILSRLAYEPTDLVEKPAISQAKPLAFSFNKMPEVFSPGHRLREPSVVSFHKNAALDEVFRRPYRGDTMRTTTQDMDDQRRNSTTAVDKWMQLAENEGGASPPLEQPRDIVERLELRRPNMKRAITTDKFRPKRSRDLSRSSRSVVSDPDPPSAAPSRIPHRIDEEAEPLEISSSTQPQETDADGDDENDRPTPALGESAVSVVNKQSNERMNEDDDSDAEYFHTPTAGRSPFIRMSSAAQARLQDAPDLLQPGSLSQQVRANVLRQAYSRNPSSATILHAPIADDSSATNPPRRPGHSKNNSGGTSTPIPIAAGARTPKMKPLATPKARPIMPPRQNTAPLQEAHGMSFIDTARRPYRQPSFNARALDLASEIGDNRWGPIGGIDAGGISGMPASFSEQLMRERDLERRREEQRRQSEEAEKGMVNRIMLARMHTLEEGFREVLKEIKDLSSHNAGSSRRDSEADVGGGGDGPKTPFGRIGGNDGRPRKSPRKIQRRSGKGKEAERPGSSLTQAEMVGTSPESERRRENVVTGAGLEVERPGTALKRGDGGEEDGRE
ncbi:hypothetical protein BAUCODRAFT_143148 [Baudoinia panamericana UAMH 10762]|uniref:Calcium channel YVC1-like C-terminal transmembrane domain-containing protein n=1 Tax=Baudoinia panamericana (strain UAMH 10762) TaxID=717646 RepID=M2MY64_BAUPA|nr:uncharacterized protein BAUCODRAFT_143148 [Baudoinia panamericana UAMH 10762]EMC91604.1 hypothetical protein BAUCODRAFT_143148 [Baudoinia panamericana UAMH 10762]